MKKSRGIGYHYVYEGCMCCAFITAYIYREHNVSEPFLTGVNSYQKVRVFIYDIYTEGNIVGMVLCCNYIAVDGWL